MEVEKMQSVIDEAYKKWDDDLEFGQFVATLDAKQRLAVLVGKLNYQVGNGGFLQWHENGYSSEGHNLLVQLSLYKKEPVVAEVMEIVEKALKIIDKYEKEIKEAERGWDANYDEAEHLAEQRREALDPLDDKYYDLEDEFLAFIERTVA